MCRQEEHTTNEKKVWNRSNSNGCESPKPARKLFMTSSEELTKVNGEMTPLSGDLESLKQEILREMRKEMTRLRQEIIDGKFTSTWKAFIEYYLVKRVLKKHFSYFFCFPRQRVTFEMEYWWTELEDDLGEGWIKNFSF